MEKWDRVHLPNHPKVKVRGNAIVIIDENDEEYLWGYEENEIIAIAIAEDIQLGLRAIHFVKKSLVNLLREIMEFLTESGVPKEHLDDILFEGYIGIQKWFIELANQRSNEVVLST